MIAYASSESTGTTWLSWGMIILIFLALYFFTIRPQNKRDKELRNLRNSLKPGDEIITIGGIYGKIVRVTDDRVVIMVGSEKTKLELAKNRYKVLMSCGRKRMSIKRYGKNRSNVCLTFIKRGWSVHKNTMKQRLSMMLQ